MEKGGTGCVRCRLNNPCPDQNNKFGSSTQNSNHGDYLAPPRCKVLTACDARLQSLLERSAKDRETLIGVPVHPEA